MVLPFIPRKSAKLLDQSVNLHEIEPDLEMPFKGRRKSMNKIIILSESGEAIQAKLKEKRERRRVRLTKQLWKISVVGFAAATVGTNIYSFLLSGGIWQYLACVFSSLVSSLVAVLRGLLLEDTETFKAIHNFLLEIVNDFAIDNAQLVAQIAHEVSVQVFCMKEAEGRVKVMTRDQYVNVASVLDLVVENRNILEEREQLLRFEYRGIDGCHSASKHGGIAIKLLLSYLKSLPTVQVHETRLLRVIENGRSVVALLELVHDIGRNDLSDDQRIFVIDVANQELQREVSERKVSRITPSTLESVNGVLSMEETKESSMKSIIEGMRRAQVLELQLKSPESELSFQSMDDFPQMRRAESLPE